MSMSILNAGKITKIQPRFFLREMYEIFSNCSCPLYRFAINMKKKKEYIQNCQTIRQTTHRRIMPQFIPQQGIFPHHASRFQKLHFKLCSHMASRYWLIWWTEMTRLSCYFRGKRGLAWKRLPNSHSWQI